MTRPAEPRPPARQDEKARGARRRQYLAAFALGGVAAGVFAAAIVFEIVQQRSGGGDGDLTAAESAAIAMRGDSRRLDEAVDGRATLVTFMDFECNACGSAHQFIESMRAAYAGRVTFVIRYFPPPRHRKAEYAAWALEAAARQGKFDQMYQRMFSAQSSYAEPRRSQADAFRKIASELGLDMAEFDADVASRLVRAAVEEDIDDGKRLGVTGSPAYFVNGQRVEVSRSRDLAAALDAELR